jgi:glucose/arabinose dehydrogenase
LRRRPPLGGLAALVLLLAGGAAAAAEPPPGTRIEVRIEALPRLGATPAAAQPPEIVPRPQGTAPAVPEGYRARLWAEGLSHPRNLLALPDGGLLVAESRPGRLTLLRDSRGEGRADVRKSFAGGFATPFGLAWHQGAIWVADTEAVWRLPWTPGSDRPGRRRRLTEAGALGDDSGHSTRSLAIAPDGRHFFVGIGSVANLDVEPAPRATIQRFDIDGGTGQSFAAGLRNPVGLAFRPGSDELWTVANERDGEGDEMVPDYLTRVEAGAFYGWPYAWLGPHPQPGFAGKAPAMVAATRPPELLFRAHSAPLGLVFWHGDAFVALHGSWNRSRPQGYVVARVPFENGRPRGWYEVFASGFLLGTRDGRPQAWGRPAGLAVGADDALYVADDAGRTVWRIARER